MVATPTDVHTRFGNRKTSCRVYHWNPFDRQNLLFNPNQVAGVPRQTAVAANYTVAGDADWYRVIAEGLGHRPHGFGLADRFRDPLVGHYCAVRHLGSGPQDL